MTSPNPRRDAAGQTAAGESAPLDAEHSIQPPVQSEQEPPFERRWVWMDRWDPATWEMPSNPTKLQRVLAGVALIIVFVMTIYVPFKMLGVF